jgi:hypothetical protein
MEVGKPSIGNPIPSRYKVSLSDVERRLRDIEKRFNILSHPTMFEKADTEIVEYNGHLIKRDLSSGLYKVLDVTEKQVIPGDFNQLQRAKDAIDLRVGGQELMELRQHVKDINQN